MYFLTVITKKHTLARTPELPVDRLLGEEVLMSAVMQPVGAGTGADWNGDGLCTGLVLPSQITKLLQVPTSLDKFPEQKLLK